MLMEPNLNIPDQFLVLAHKQDKPGFTGSGISDQYLIFGLTGAILLDLSRLEAIRTEGGLIVPTGKEPDLCDAAKEALHTIRQSKKNRKVKYWVRKLDSLGHRYKKDALLNLHRQGMIRLEKKKFLGLIPYRKSYLLNWSYRKKRLEHLRKVMFSSKEASTEDAILLALISACGISSILASHKKERKKIRKTLKAFTRNNEIAGAVSKTLQEIQAAVAASVSAAAVASTAGAGN